MAGQRQKDPALLAFKRGGRGRGLTVLSRDGSFVVPEAPKGLQPTGQRAWDSFWRSEVSAAVNIAEDRVDLEDWATAVDERARYLAIVKEAPLIKGSHQQLMLNPLFRRLEQLDNKIRAYSDRFGMNPLARWRLQFTVTEAGKSANDLLKMLAGDPEQDIIDMDELG